MSFFSKHTRSQLYIVISMIVLALLSIISTKLIVDLSSKSNSKGGGYQNVTMTDAYLKCAERVSNEYQGELYSYSMDDLSTRFDQQKKHFLVFMNVEVIGGPKQASEASFVLCEISVAGSISNFEISVETDTDGGRVRKSKGNPFGFEF